MERKVDRQARDELPCLSTNEGGFEMTITIAPFTIDRSHDRSYPSRVYVRDGLITPITYWGIYIDDKNVSYTSSKELAEKTKIWMEKWLRQR
jgi:hypothetical protein